MSQREEVARTFEAKDDDGNQYMIVEWQKYTIFRPLNGPEQEIKAGVRYTLNNGDGVTHLRDGTYQILNTGTKLTAQ